MRRWAASDDSTVVYRGKRLVESRRLQVECRSSSRAFLISVGRRVFHVSRASGEITTSGTGGDAPTALPLLVSLALRGVFSWHASSVASPVGVVAFVGRSGAGKSTLAGYLARHRRHPWPLVSDDVLALDPSDRLPRAVDVDPLTRVAPSSGSPILAAVFVLRRCPRPSVVSRRLSQREALVALTRHSVATPLFDAPLRAAHFDACAKIASSVPVREIFYPRVLSVLGQVRERIASDLEAARELPADGSGLPVEHDVATSLHQEPELAR